MGNLGLWAVSFPREAGSGKGEVAATRWLKATPASSCVLG